MELYEIARGARHVEGGAMSFGGRRMAWGAQHDPSSEDLGEIKRNNFDFRGQYVYP